MTKINNLNIKPAFWSGVAWVFGGTFLIAAYIHFLYTFMVMAHQSNR